jgi:hypothetical protein
MSVEKSISINIMHIFADLKKSMSWGHIYKTANLMNCELFPQPAFILHSLEINKINIEVPKNKFESNSSHFL